MTSLHSSLLAQHDPCQTTSHGTTATNGEKINPNLTNFVSLYNPKMYDDVRVSSRFVDSIEYRRMLMILAADA